jgi:hypothetical protein
MGEFATVLSAGDVRANRENKQVEAMLADLIKGPFVAGRKFKFHQTDPATGKRETKEIGG